MTHSPQIAIFDGHNDTLLRLYMPKPGQERSFFERASFGHIDLPRAEAGGLAGGFFAVFVPAPPRRIDAHGSAQFRVEEPNVGTGMTGGFARYHVERKKLASESEITEFVAANGVDKAKFTEAYKSFGVNTKLNRGTGSGIDHASAKALAEKLDELEKAMPKKGK